MKYGKTTNVIILMKLLKRQYTSFLYYYPYFETILIYIVIHVFKQCQKILCYFNFNNIDFNHSINIMILFCFYQKKSLHKNLSLEFFQPFIVLYWFVVHRLFMWFSSTLYDRVNQPTRFSESILIRWPLHHSSIEFERKHWITKFHLPIIHQSDITL